MTSKKIKNQGISIRDKLRNIAHKEKKQVRSVYMAYIFERFLHRVSISKYRDSLILKGGVYLYSENLDFRETVDIDFLDQNIPRQTMLIEAIICEICLISTKDPLAFHIDRITTMETMIMRNYHGVKI